MRALQPIESFKTVFAHITLAMGLGDVSEAGILGQVNEANLYRSAQNYRVKDVTLANQCGLLCNLGVSIMKSNEFVRPTLAKADFVDFTDIH